MSHPVSGFPAAGNAACSGHPDTGNQSPAVRACQLPFAPDFLAFAASSDISRRLR